MDSILRLLIDATSEGIVELDFQDQSAHYSARWRAMFGFDAHAGERWQGPADFWRTLVHPADAEELEACWREHTEDVWPFDHQCRFRFAGGGYRWVAVRSNVRREGTTPAQALITFTDVTEKVESQQRQVALLEAIPDAMLCLSAEGDVTAWRAGAGQRMPLPDEVEQGSALQSVALDARFAKVVLECAAQARVEQAPVEREWLSRDTGSAVCIEIRAVTSGGDEVLCILRDVSEKKKLELQLLQSQKLESIGSLAAGVAHEINTPAQFIGDNLTFLERGWSQLEGYLAAVDALVQTLEAPLAQPVLALAKKSRVDYLRRQAPSAIAQSLDGTTRISSIVGAMKSFSHPGDEVALRNLNEALQTTATVARSEWRHVADLDFALDEALPVVPCALGSLNQVFLNILVNAAHAIGDKHAGTGDKGHISIRTVAGPAHAIIEIEDDGGGIPAAIRDRIFDPFFTTKAVGKGTGQGLAIAQNVVVGKHQGELEVESVEGVGTTFRIKLPYEGVANSRGEDSGISTVPSALSSAGEMIG